MNKLEKHFDSRSVQRGRALFQNGAVLSINSDPHKNQVHARVQGTQPTPYEVTLILDDVGEPERAWCSCPVAFNCKHAVATLLVFRSDLMQAHRKHGPTKLAPDGIQKNLFSADPSETMVRQWWQRWQATQPEPARADLTSSSWDRPRSRIYSLSTVKRNGHWDIGVLVTLLDAPRTAAGQFNKGRRAETEHSFTSHTLQLSSIDKDIQALGSARLQADKGRYTRDTGRYELNGHFGELMLELTIKTDRCFLQADRRQPLTIGPSRALSIDWHPETSSSHRMVPTLSGLEHCWVVTTDLGGSIRSVLPLDRSTQSLPGLNLLCC